MTSPTRLVPEGQGRAAPPRSLALGVAAGPGPGRLLPQFRFHELRHTGNTLAAATGASTEELMSRTGHASLRAP